MGWTDHYRRGYLRLMALLSTTSRFTSKDMAKIILQSLIYQKSQKSQSQPLREMFRTERDEQRRHSSPVKVRLQRSDISGTKTIHRDLQARKSSKRLVQKYEQSRLIANPAEREDILRQLSHPAQDDTVDPDKSTSQVGEGAPPALELLRKHGVLVVIVSVDTMDQLISSQLYPSVDHSTHFYPPVDDDDNVDVKTAHTAKRRRKAK